MGFIFLALEPWAGGPIVGLGLLIPKISLPYFYPPHVDVDPFHVSAPPSSQMDVVSLIL